MHAFFPYPKKKINRNQKHKLQTSKWVNTIYRCETKNETRKHRWAGSDGFSAVVVSCSRRFPTKATMIAATQRQCQNKININNKMKDTNGTLIGYYIILETNECKPNLGDEHN